MDADENLGAKGKLAGVGCVTAIAAIVLTFVLGAPLNPGRNPLLLLFGLGLLATIPFVGPPFLQGLREPVKPPEIVVKTYKADGFGSEKKVAKLYEADAAKMAAKGYEPILSAAQGPKPATMLLGGLGHLASGTMTVTYKLRAPSTASAVPVPAPSGSDTRPGMRVREGVQPAEVAVSPPRGHTTPTAALAPSSGTPTRAMKRCPDCAEDVFAEAKICRSCRHEFVDALSVATTAEAVQTSYTVTLEAVGPDRGEVVEVVMKMTGRGLKDAYELVTAAERSLTPVASGLSHGEAVRLQQSLEAAGARASVS